jgi:hypothetical protein
MKSAAPGGSGESLRAIGFIELQRRHPDGPLRILRLSIVPAPFVQVLVVEKMVLITHIQDMRYLPCSNLAGTPRSHGATAPNVYFLC